MSKGNGVRHDNGKVGVPIHERTHELLGNSINCPALFIMGKAKDLSQYIAWLRHNYTNYDKYLRIMYDEFGEQTDIRKYVNSILYRVMTNQLDAEEALQNIRHIIKIAGYQPPPKPTQKTLNKKAQILENKRARRRRNKARRQERDANKGWEKAINKYNKQLEKQEQKIRMQYEQIMLYKIGLSWLQLSKKLLPKE